MGTMGLSKDPQKAMELLHRAAEMGAIGAHQNLGFAYCHGKDVEKNLTKAVYHYQIAAVGGITIARYEYLIILYYYICVCKVSHPQSCLCLPRHNLGCLECQAGNVSRGMKH